MNEAGFVFRISPKTLAGSVIITAPEAYEKAKGKPQKKNDRPNRASTSHHPKKFF